MNKKRNSSLELLRIICMLLIIAHHYSVHGDLLNFSYQALNTGHVFTQILAQFGRISCSVFALISGYFLINAEKNIIIENVFP